MHKKTKAIIPNTTLKDMMPTFEWGSLLDISRRKLNKKNRILNTNKIMNISKPYSKNDSTLSIFANIAEERLNPATRTATIDEKTPKIVMYSVLCLLKSS